MHINLPPILNPIVADIYQGSDDWHDPWYVWVLISSVLQYDSVTSLYAAEAKGPIHWSGSRLVSTT